MAEFTYEADFDTDRDRMRYLIQDTDPLAPLFMDSEIAHGFSLNSNIYLAGASMLDALAVRYTRRPDTVIDGLSISNAARAAGFRALAKDLRNQARQNGSIGMPFVGGISLGEIAAVEANTDRPPPRAKTGMDDFPGTQPEVP